MIDRWSALQYFMGKFWLLQESTLIDVSLFKLEMPFHWDSIEAIIYQVYFISNYSEILHFIFYLFFGLIILLSNIRASSSLLDYIGQHALYCCIYSS
jgi:hypothetical protein